MIYTITERIVVDDEVGFSCDVSRAAALVNMGRSVAVGTFYEAVEVLRELGMSDSAIRTQVEKSVEGNPLPDGVAELGWGG